MRHLKLVIAVAGVAALASAGAAFGSGAHVSAASTVVTTKHTSLGTILVTSTGKTLYADSGDKPPHFACTAGCLQAWPPLKAAGALKATGAAKAADLGKVKGPAGEMVTYKGHPLYTFVSDTKSGQTSGEGVNGFYAVSPAGSMVKNAAKTVSTTTSTSSSGGGW